MNNSTTSTQPLFNATTTSTANLLTSGEPNYDISSTTMPTTDLAHQKILVFDSISAILFLLILSATFTIVIFYNNNHVRGNCIICFENLKPGDTIVHNTETKGCPHVYHKSCMVEYLSNQNRSIKQLKNTVDMDPTCRQPFCKLLEPLNNESDDKMSDIPL